jgi:hypothetical protein
LRPRGLLAEQITDTQHKKQLLTPPFREPADESLCNEKTKKNLERKKSKKNRGARLSTLAARLPGTHFLTYNGKIIFYNRTNQERRFKTTERRRTTTTTTTKKNQQAKKFAQ